MINIPAIKGQIGNTIYYIANLTFSQIATMVSRVNDELHTANSIKEQIQRSLSDNYIKIRDYIIKREDHFFDSLVLAVYDGDPRWKEVRYEIDGVMYSNVGLLELNGNEQIFPLDGQHRLEGIRAALKENDKCANDVIPIMLIGHDCTPEGKVKSRRIFSILNRYAKPVGKGDIIALDEDDIVAIETRDLLENNKLFMGNRIKVSNSKSIPVTDKTSFTTLMTLYDCLDELFKAFHFQKTGKLLSAEKLKDYKRMRPVDEEIEEFHLYLSAFWNEMLIHFPELEEYVGDDSNECALKYRPQGEGGNLFFRPVGLLPFISAVCRIVMDNQHSYEEILSFYAGHLNRDVSSEYWRGILWEPVSKKMLVRNGTLVKYLMIAMYPEEILTERDKKDMIDRYVSLFSLADREEAEKRIADLYSN